MAELDKFLPPQLSSFPTIVLTVLENENPRDKSLTRWLKSSPVKQVSKIALLGRIHAICCRVQAPGGIYTSHLLLKD